MQKEKAQKSNPAANKFKDYHEEMKKFNGIFVYVKAV